MMSNFVVGPVVDKMVSPLQQSLWVHFHDTLFEYILRGQPPHKGHYSGSQILLYIFDLQNNLSTKADITQLLEDCTYSYGVLTSPGIFVQSA